MPDRPDPNPSASEKSVFLFNLVQSRTFSLLFLFAISLLSKMAYFWKFGIRHIAGEGDGFNFIRLADTIWNHHVFGFSPGQPVHLEHVVYMLFLSPFVGLFGDRPAAAILAQYLLAAACAPLAYLVARRLAGNLAGWIAGLFCVSYLPLVVYPSRFMTETLFTFLFFLALFLGDRLFSAKEARSACKRAVALGAVLALLALTRTIGFPLILVPAVLYAFFSWKDKKRAALVVAVCCGSFAFAYSPWVIRNYIAFDRIIILLGNKITVTAPSRTLELMSEGYDLNEARRIVIDDDKRKRKNGVAFEAGPAQGFFSAKYLSQVAKRFLIMTGFNPGVKAKYPVTGTTVAKYPFVRPMVHAWHYALYPFLLVAFIHGLWKRDFPLLHSILFPLALLTLYAMVHAIPRYQIPIFAAFSIPAGVGMAHFFARVARLRRPAR